LSCSFIPRTVILLAKRAERYFIGDLLCGIWVFLGKQYIAYGYFKMRGQQSLGVLIPTLEHFTGPLEQGCLDIPVGIGACVDFSLLLSIGNRNEIVNQKSKKYSTRPFPHWHVQWYAWPSQWSARPTLIQVGLIGVTWLGVVHVGLVHANVINLCWRGWWLTTSASAWLWLTMWALSTSMGAIGDGCRVMWILASIFKRPLPVLLASSLGGHWWSWGNH
jgi:hypothetical protein